MYIILLMRDMIISLDFLINRLTFREGAVEFDKLVAALLPRHLQGPPNLHLSLPFPVLYLLPLAPGYVSQNAVFVSLLPFTINNFIIRMFQLKITNTDSTEKSFIYIYFHSYMITNV